MGHTVCLTSCGSQQRTDGVMKIGNGLLDGWTISGGSWEGTEPCVRRRNREALDVRPQQHYLPPHAFCFMCVGCVPPVERLRSAEQQNHDADLEVTAKLCSLCLTSS